MTTASRWFWILLENVALATFVGMLVLVIAQIFFRYLLQISVPWTEEAARWFYVYQIFLGSAVALKRGLHLRATFLLEKFPKRVQSLVECLIGVTGLIFLAGTLWGSVLMMRAVYPVQAGSFPIRMTYLYLALPISLTVMIWLTVTDIVRECRSLARPSQV